MEGTVNMNYKAAIGLGIILSGAACMSAFAATEGQWVENGVKFQKPDGSLARNEWIEGENGSYFYVGADGSYVTGWQTIREKNSETEHSYYFNPSDGAMYYDTYTPDGYWVNADGVWVPGETGNTAGETEQTETADGAAAENGEAAAGEADAGESLSESYVSGGYSTTDAGRLVALINAKRAEAGKEALPLDEDLTAAAEICAQEIAAYPDDSDIYNRPEAHYLTEAKSMTRSAVTAVSGKARGAFTKGNAILITESAAWNVSSADEAVENWFAKNSEGKDKNDKTFMLDAGNNGFNAIGASCYVKNGRQYYSVFIGVRQ